MSPISPIPQKDNPKAGELKREAPKANQDNSTVENQAPSQCVAVRRSDKIVEKAGSSTVARFARSGILKKSSDNLQ